MKEDKKILKWVQGNKLLLAIPLQSETKTKSGVVKEDYYPSIGDTIKVNLKGEYKVYGFDATFDGNVVYITDNGTLPVGTYGVEIIIVKEDGSLLRSMWCNIIEILNCNKEVLEEWDDFVAPSSQTLDAAIFFFAKGEQGVGIMSVEQIHTSEESLGVNVIRVTLTNGETSDFEVRNGAKPTMYVENKTLHFK